jgi:hypothetical protein
VSDALLTLLKWCLLGLVYLFFFRVLQVTWSGATSNVAVRRARRGGKADGADRGRNRPAGQAQRSGPISLVILEPPTDAGTRFEVTGESTIGRDAGCQITLSDTYISQFHARVSITDDGIVVEDLGSTNGTYLNQQLVTRPVVAQPDDRLQLGGIIMELRSSQAAAPTGTSVGEWRR